jgi:co-chaperonin GroES (HSP10)
MKTEGDVQFHPMPGKIVVRLHTEEKVGNLYLPTDARQSRVMGRVIALGDDETEGDPYELEVGDMILFTMAAGARVRVDREEVVILHTREVLCRLTWEAPSEA